MYIEVQAHNVRPPAYACFARKDAARFSEGIQKIGGEGRIKNQPAFRNTATRYNPIRYFCQFYAFPTRYFLI